MKSGVGRRLAKKVTLFMTAGNKQLTSYVTIFGERMRLGLIEGIYRLGWLVVINMTGNGEQYHRHAQHDPSR